MDKVVDVFRKNTVEEVRACLQRYRGHRLIDLRVYYHHREGAEPAPTKKGLTLSVRLLPQLKRAVLRLEEALIAEGLLDPEDCRVDST